MFLSERREFLSAPCLAGKNNLMTARVSKLLKSRASLMCFRSCFLPGRVKDLSELRVQSKSRTSKCQCSLLKKNPIIRIFYISGWLAVPMNLDKGSSTTLQEGIKNGKGKRTQLSISNKESRSTPTPNRNTTTVSHG